MKQMKTENQKIYKAKILTLIRLSRKPDRIKGIIIEDYKTYFVFKSYSGRIFRVNKFRTLHWIEDINEDYRDLSSPERLNKDE
jgi:hypothetical protein